MRIRNAALVILAIFTVATYAVHEASGTSSGIIGYSKSGCGGGGCHGSQSANTAISISTGSSQIVAGQTYAFRLSVANPAEHAAGCDISVDNGGKLAVDGSNSGLQFVSYSGGELTHTSPRVFSSPGDSAVWLFNYTAPLKTGMTHIFIACNAVNLNGTNDAGDHWNLRVDTLNIAAAAVNGKQVSAANLELFPNPSTSGRFTLSTPGIDGNSEISVINVAGKIVFQSQILLGLEEPLDLSALPDGTYFVSLQTNTGQHLMRRIVLAR